MYVLYLSSDAWAPLVEEALAERDPIPAPRQYLAISTQAQASAAPLPTGYRLAAVDATLLDRDDLEPLDALREEIGSEHASVEAFLQTNFGVCAIHRQREIAGWCLSEYANAERCEVGIETLHPHRRRGLGTAMTAALVEVARARGLAQVGWHSYTRNVPSIRTARKAGMHKVCDYPAYIGHFDPIVHLCERGYTAVGKGQMEAGLGWFETAFAQAVAPGWAYYAAGCAYAVLGRSDEAFSSLGQAIEHGFAVRAIYESDERLRVLHDTSEWTALLKRLGGPGAAG
jgi:RimJ/RimL family protein N-acetyltransferase